MSLKEGVINNIKKCHDVLVNSYFNNKSLALSCEEYGVKRCNLNNFLFGMRRLLNPKEKEKELGKHVNKLLESGFSVREYSLLNNLPYEILYPLVRSGKYKKYLDESKYLHPQFYEFLFKPLHRCGGEKKNLKKREEGSLEIIKKYELMEESNRYWGTLKDFLAAKGETYTPITKYNYAMKYHRNNPEVFEEYSKHIAIIRKENLTVRSYAAKHNLNIATLKVCAKNIRYREIIEKYKKEKEKEEMNFIPVNQEEKKREEVVQPVKPQVSPVNNIELSISTDIKVFVSKDVPTDKLIKIIDFLKGL